MQNSTFHIEPKLGEGIYSTKDISEILDLPYHKVRRSMGGFWHNYTFGNTRDKAINFLTLIEFYTYYQLRQTGIKPNIIKKAHKAISDQLNTPYPFARDIIHTDGKEVWYELLEVIINADGTNQINIVDLIKPFLNKVEFKNRVAEKYFPLEGSKNIVVDPKYQFGHPIINGTRIKAEIVSDFYVGGETIHTLCEAYNLSEDQVKDAIIYYKQSA